MSSKVNIFQLSRWTTSLVYNLSPFYLTGTALFTLIDETINVLNIYVFANIFGQLIQIAGQSSPNFSSLYYYLGIKILLSILQRVSRFFLRYFSFALNYDLQPKLTQHFYQKIYSLEIQTLERPDTQNSITRANEGVINFYSFTSSLLGLAASIFRLTVASIQLCLHFPLFFLLTILLRLPMYFNDKYFRNKNWQIIKQNTEKRRKASQNGGYLFNTKSLHEITLTRAFSFFSHEFYDFFYSYNRQQISLRRTWFSRLYTLNIFSDLGLFLIYAKLILDIATRKINSSLAITLYRMTEVVDSGVFDTIQNVNELQELQAKILDIYDLFQLKPAFKDGKTILPKQTKGPSINFQNISFKYPDAEFNVFEGLNLQIKPGEKIAIVGENGAGKTTLVKLICRIYQVSQGCIYINQYQLDKLKINSLYKNFGVLFQEYNTYPQLTVAQNIALGLPDRKINLSRVKKAARYASATKFIEALPNKYNQMLSESFKNGIRLSTGQWQKIALARFFYRDSPLVIFDEPTASIDAVAEAKIFGRIYRFFKNKTVIIISHRFSTVRHADRIIVLDKGKVIEQGSHEELLSLSGRYASSFRLQAEGYILQKSI